MILFVALSWSLAQAEDSSTLLFSTISTASQFKANTIEARSTSLSSKLLFSYRASEGAVLHKDFKMETFSLGYQFQNIRSKPILTAGLVGRDIRSNYVDAGVASVRGEDTVFDKLYFSYLLGLITMSEEFQTLYTVDTILRGETARLGGSYRWSEKWRSTFYLQEFFLNDGNTRSNHDLGLFYGLATGDPWIWVGVGAGRLSNSIQNRGYWTPLEFYTIGPRLDLALTFWDDWKFLTGLNLNYFKDVTTGEGKGYYATSKLTYKVFKVFELFAALESIQSEQFGRVWKSNAVTGGVTGNW